MRLYFQEPIFCGRYGWRKFGEVQVATGHKLHLRGEEGGNARTV